MTTKIAPKVPQDARKLMIGSHHGTTACAINSPACAIFSGDGFREVLQPQTAICANRGMDNIKPIVFIVLISDPPNSDSVPEENQSGHHGLNIQFDALV
jgi:hypothetical protein